MTAIPDYPPVEIKVWFSPQEDPYISDDCGLAPWLLYEVLDRVTRLTGERFEVAPEVAETGEET